MTFFTDANRTRAKEIVARVPAPEVGDPAARAPRAGSERVVVAGGDERDRRAHRRDHRRGAGHVLLLHDVQAASVREAGRVGVHQRHVSRHRRARDPRAARGALRARRGRDGRRSRVPGRVRRRALDAGELRVPRDSSRPRWRHTMVEEYKSGARTARTISGSPFPDSGVALISEERRIVTKRLHDRPDDSWTIDGALASGAYEVLRATLAQGRPGRRPGTGEGVGPARSRRRQLLDRAEVVVPAPRPVPALPRRERRRGRALDVQGPDAGRTRSAPAHRRHRHLGVRDPVQSGVHLPARRVRARLRPLDAGARRRARRRASSAPTSSARASTSRSSCTAARARTSAARRPRCSSRSRASGACRA